MDSEVQAWTKPIAVVPGTFHPGTYVCSVHGPQAPDSGMWVHYSLRACPIQVNRNHEATYSDGKTYQQFAICGIELTEQV